MANNFITPTWVVKEVGRLAINSLKFAANCTREYSSDFKAGGAKVGATINLRLPQRFQTVKGQAFSGQAINDQIVPVSITDQAQIGISWSTFDATLSVENVRDRYIRPAATQLANTIDFDGLSRCSLDVFHSVGTVGVTPTSVQTYLDAVTKLRNVGAPDDGLVAILNPQAQATLVGNTTTVFNPTAAISSNWRKGQFGNMQLGIDQWYYDQNVLIRTTGSFTTATPLVNGTTAQGATSLVTDGWASGASTLNKGDKFTIANVYEINPQNYSSTGQLQQFVVTQTISDTTGAMTIQVQPAMISSGNLATISAMPANDAAIIPVGSTITTSSGAMTATATSQNLVYHPDAFVLAFVDADADLAGADVAMVSAPDLGFSLRYVRQYNAQTDQKISRIDCFYGWKSFRPEWACVVNGA